MAAFLHYIFEVYTCITRMHTCACMFHLDYFSFSQPQLERNCNCKTEDCSQSFTHQARVNTGSDDSADYPGHLDHFLCRSGGPVDEK